VAHYGLEHLYQKADSRYYIAQAAILHSQGKHAEAQQFLEDQKKRRRATERGYLAEAQAALKRAT
jgi:hypothetical protein